MKKHFEKIKSEGTCIHRLDEELIRRRREELRSVDSLLCLLLTFPIQPSLLQLNEPGSLSFSPQGMCSSPWLFSCFCCTEDPKPGLSIPGGINSGSLNSLWVQKVKLPQAPPRPWALPGWGKARERERVETVPALGRYEQFAPGKRGKGLCVYQGIFLPEFVITALKQVHPSQWKTHLAVYCELSLPWCFLCISYFQRSEHAPGLLEVNALLVHRN